MPDNRAAPLPAERAGLRERVGHALRWRGLLQYLTISNLKAGQHNTLFGYLWWVLDPLLLMAVYVVLVDIILQRGVENENYPVFVLSAVLPWKWFVSSVQASMGSLVGKERLIKQVAFPKLIIPLSQVLANLASFGFGLIVLVVFAMALGVGPKWTLVAVPIIVVAQLFLILGVALLLSTANIFFRDIQNMSGYLLRLWFYLSPSLYALSMVPSEFRGIYDLNPYARIFPAYRDAVMRGDFPAAGDLLWIFAVGVAVLAVGLAVFVRTERQFAKVL